MWRAAPPPRPSSPTSLRSCLLYFTMLPVHNPTQIVSYTEVASQLTALQVVRLLNELYTQFDLLCDKHEVYKVETIGDGERVHT